MILIIEFVIFLEYLKYEITQHNSSNLLETTLLFNNTSRTFLSSIIGNYNSYLYN
jgi:hypothetical protein